MRMVYPFIIVLLCAACSQPAEESMQYQKREFGQMPDGEVVSEYTFSNAANMQFSVIPFGAIITSIKVPDRDGNIDEVCLGFPDLKGYLDEHPYFGAIVGRYGNRIGKGQFELDGQAYQLATNNGPNHLHGGLQGFDKLLWTVKEVGDNSILLSLSSPDGQEGYPGKLDVEVRYALTESNEIQIDYHAVSDASTIVNLTNHAYFNLKDAGKTDILSHELQLNSSAFTPVDSTLIPTGEIQSVSGGPFDFRAAKPIGQDIEAEDIQIQYGKGYDHNFVLTPSKAVLNTCARVFEPSTGRQLEILTTEPGVQFYTGNFLEGDITGHGERAYHYRNAFCLETQHFPDSPNKANFPAVRLDPGQTYQSQTVYRFSTR